MDDDAVFKALADPTRRKLLDKLYTTGGLTQGQLEEGLGMTRFGVAKHLRILEEANLVITQRSGRQKAPLPQHCADSPHPRPLDR